MLNGSVPSNSQSNRVRRWYAVYTKARFEKKVAQELDRKGIENYLPLVKEVHRWSDRNKLVEVPLIRGYVFVHIALNESLYVLETLGVVRFVMFNHEYAPIPDFQIEALKRVMAEGFQLTPVNWLGVGQLVEVTDGPLKGTIGRIQQIQNEYKFVISLDAIKTSYLVQVSAEYLKPVTEEKRKAIFTPPLGF